MAEDTDLEALVRNTMALSRNLADRDDLRAIIMGQTWLEHVVARLVSRGLKHPDQLDVGRQQFWRKLQLGKALGELHDHADVLDKIAKIRSRFAHDLRGQLDPKRVEEVEKALPERARDMLGGTKKFIHRLVMAADREEPPRVFPRPDLTPVQLMIRAAISVTYTTLLLDLESPTYAEVLKRAAEGLYPEGSSIQIGDAVDPPLMEDEG